ncbi:MAG: hypothetical protein WBD63_03875 [Phycisphaerae bacterium]|nr:hypothetical protein [Phycisphaerae bacterium]
MKQEIERLRVGAVDTKIVDPAKPTSQASPPVDTPLQFADLETLVRRAYDSKSSLVSAEPEKRVAVALKKVVGKQVVLAGVLEELPESVRGITEAVLQYKSEDTVQVLSVAGRTTLTGTVISPARYADEPKNNMTIRAQLREQQVKEFRHGELVEVSGTIASISATVRPSGQMWLSVKLNEARKAEKTSDVSITPVSEPMVYVWTDEAVYHRASCRLLNRPATVTSLEKFARNPLMGPSLEKMKVSEAKEQGCRPCSACEPPSK